MGPRLASGGSFPLLEATSQMVGVETERIANTFERERPRVIVGTEPLFGLEEQPLLSASLASDVATERRNRFFEYCKHETGVSAGRAAFSTTVS